jgi:phosphopentomutase
LFNQKNPLGNPLPGLFAERHWDRSTGVTDPHTFENQIAIVERSLAALPAERRAFTFVNVAAVHQPNHFYLTGGPEKDTVASHAAALRYVDAHLPRLFDVLRRRGPVFAIVTSDHGTLYPIVTTVPYAEVML